MEVLIFRPWKTTLAPASSLARRGDDDDPDAQRQCRRAGHGEPHTERPCAMGGGRPLAHVPSHRGRITRRRLRLTPSGTCGLAFIYKAPFKA